MSQDKGADLSGVIQLEVLILVIVLHGKFVARKLDHNICNSVALLVRLSLLVMERNLIVIFKV